MKKFETAKGSSLSGMPVISPSTLVQIDELDLNVRPLIICDVDEVLLHFVRGLENHLERSGYWLKKTSFALNGNIRRADNDTAAGLEDVRDLISGFFAMDAAQLEAIDGARESLASLDKVADIVLLTNLPEKYRFSRIANLQKHGIHHPVVTNDGPKGPAAVEIAKKSGTPVFFLDDAPNNIESVRDALPHAHIIHFVGDKHFSAVLDPVAGVHLRTGSWAETHKYIWSILQTTDRP